MSDGNIEIKFSVEDAAAFRAWQRQQDAARKLKKELDALKNSGDKFGSALASMGGKAASALGNAAAQLTGIGTAVGALVTFAQQLITEIETVKQKNKAAGQANVGIVPSLNSASQNSGGVLSDSQILNMAKEVSLETGQKVSKVLDTFGAAWAAGVPENGAAARATAPVAKSVLKTFPNADAEVTAQITSVVQTIMKRFNMSADEAVGFYLRSGEGNFSRDNAPLSKHAIPAGIKGTAFGDSLEESQGIVNTFSQSMQDADAAQSSHAANVFQEQLRERLPNLPNTQSRVEYLRANPKEAQAFMDGGTIAGKKFDAAKKGEGGSIPTLEGILGINKAPAFVGLFEDMKRAATNIQAAGADRKGLSDRQKQQERSNLSTGPQVLAAQQRQAEAAKELQQLADADAAAKGIADQGFEGIMESSDLSEIEQRFRKMGHFWKGGGALDLANEMDMLANRQDMIRVPRTPSVSAGMGGAHQEFDTLPDPNATDEQKIKAANYRRAAMRIRELEAQRKAGVQDATSLEAAGLTTPADALKKVRQAAKNIEADKSITPEEAATARGTVRNATESVRTAEGSLSDQAIRDLKGEIFRLSQVIEANIKATEKNTKATDGNTKAPTTSAAKSPVRNGQASRSLDRSNQYQPPRQFT